jgi:hypothetical protein
LEESGIPDQARDDDIANIRSRASPFHKTSKVGFSLIYPHRWTSPILPREGVTFPSQKRPKPVAPTAQHWRIFVTHVTRR